MGKPLVTKPAPLTHKDRLGNPYVRPQWVTDEICRALTFPVSEWPARALARGEAGWKSETLVYLARALVASGERIMLGKLVYALGLRTAAVIKRWARGFDDTTLELIASEVDTDIIERLLIATPTRQSEFLEVAFELAVKRRTLQAVEVASRRQRLSWPGGIPEEHEGLSANCESLGPLSDELSAEEQIISTQDHALARQLLRSIADRRHREAYIMHYFLDWPISAKDPTVPTLCKTFHVSERQVRNWFVQAERDMRLAIGDAK